jgi:hypothetical protein
MHDFHGTFRILLHAANLRHGTDGFTSPPKEGVLKIFFALKNPTASAGFEPANLGTKGQHATLRPPKPLSMEGTLTSSPDPWDILQECEQISLLSKFTVSPLWRKTRRYSFLLGYYCASSGGQMTCLVGTQCFRLQCSTVQWDSLLDWLTMKM